MINSPMEDPTIGCVFARDTRFFRSDETADPPPEFASSVVQGKRYDLADTRWSGYFDELLRRVLNVETNIGLDLAGPGHAVGRFTATLA